MNETVRLFDMGFFERQHYLGIVKRKRGQAEHDRLVGEVAALRQAAKVGPISPGVESGARAQQSSDAKQAGTPGVGSFPCNPNAGHSRPDGCVDSGAPGN